MQKVYLSSPQASYLFSVRKSSLPKHWRLCCITPYVRSFDNSHFLVGPLRPYLNHEFSLQRTLKLSKPNMERMLRVLLFTGPAPVTTCQLNRILVIALYLLLPKMLVLPLLLLLALAFDPVGIRIICNLINGSDDFRYDLEDSFDAATDQVIALMKSCPRRPRTRPNKPPPRLFFNALPLEIRRKVYSHLLVTTSISGRCIALKSRRKTRRQNYLCHHPHALGPHLDLDARVLRTCRQMYDEGLPMLYGENHFVFGDIEDVTLFAMHRLPQYRCKLLLFAHPANCRSSIEQKNIFSPYSSMLTREWKC